ncbi:related to ADP-ribose pyrophosphatase [Saccharomycodes ludwigii]|uniref:Related to ADP-ribose pyrophosphatase n=1 Tax=Saccharomycodes ludwigii TaxID=36035 RepID=A0A376B6X3_9ASCO|nr:hypothetical protein SCDLUD_000580 [Saccharomycodes ludwigii]KAH3902978.1 hypothetical protein SCDLUD_000580 [Saccharomycodes ludwigii]SSD60329.1 related to ADP-ribose pyrophosphatase [Saccharomycodes ludwigii]
MSKGKPELSKVLSISEPESLDQCKWIGLQKIKYQDPNGKQREWDMAVRKTRTESSTSNGKASFKFDSDFVDGVAILAFLKKPNEPTKILLEKQFRPPLNGVCIEFPAGLIDPKESIETSALRELKEETGYIGKIIDKSVIIYNDPGFTNTNLSLVTVEVDLTLPENVNPKCELEDNEFIDLFTVELDNFHDTIVELNKSRGYKLDSRVYNIAQGIKLAQQFKKLGL